jgi:hypothetical protein
MLIRIFSIYSLSPPWRLPRVPIRRRPGRRPRVPRQPPRRRLESRVPPVLRGHQHVIRPRGRVPRLVLHERRRRSGANARATARRWSAPGAMHQRLGARGAGFGGGAGPQALQSPLARRGSGRLRLLPARRSLCSGAAVDGLRSALFVSVSVDLPSFPFQR